MIDDGSKITIKFDKPVSTELYNATKILGIGANNGYLTQQELAQATDIKSDLYCDSYVHSDFKKVDSGSTDETYCHDVDWDIINDKVIPTNGGYDADGNQHIDDNKLFMVSTIDETTNSNYWYTSGLTDDYYYLYSGDTAVYTYGILYDESSSSSPLGCIFYDVPRIQPSLNNFSKLTISKDGNDDFLGFICLNKTGKNFSLLRKMPSGTTSFNASYLKGVTDASYLFATTPFEKVYNLSLSPTNVDYMFFSSKIKSVDLNKLDVSSCTSLRSVFEHCTGLTYFNADSWDTSNVTDMTSLFCKCSSLSNFSSVSKWDTSNVTSMHGMFQHLRVDYFTFPEMDTSNVTDMGYMFYGGTGKKLVINNMDTSKVTNIYGMLTCSYDYVDISGLDFSSVISSERSYAFGTDALVGNIKELNMSNTTFNTDIISSLGLQFCVGLKKIYVSGLSDSLKSALMSIGYSSGTATLDGDVITIS